MKAALHSLARRLVYPAADRALESYGSLRCRSYDIRNSVALCATGRGGSTWLSELVTRLPNRVLLWEPLHLGNNPPIRRLGLGWNPYVPPDAEAPDIELYLSRLLTGRALSTRTLTRLNLDPRALAAPQGFVVKFVQAHGVMPWFTRRFPVPVIGMVRHPCAVVASQLHHGTSWRSLTKSRLDVPDQALADHPRMADAFRQIEPESTVQALAFAWAYKTYFLLQTDGILLVSYESMVTRPRSEAERVFAHLGEAVPPGALDRMETPSATTHRDATYTRAEDRLSAWQRHLSPSEQGEVLEVAHRMGVDVYSDGPLPTLPV